jgi:signal transduction histidine kinase
MSEPITANHLYRIAQEAIHNAIKHGKARTITVLFMTEAGKLVLTIQDDGAGIAQEWTPGMGLQNMKTRAQMIGATLEIHAGASGGTVVTCSLPIPNPPNSSG